MKSIRALLAALSELGGRAWKTSGGIFPQEFSRWDQPGMGTRRLRDGGTGTGHPLPTPLPPAPAPGVGFFGDGEVFSPPFPAAFGEQDPRQHHPDPNSLSPRWGQLRAKPSLKINSAIWFVATATSPPLPLSKSPKNPWKRARFNDGIRSEGRAGGRGV